MPKVLITGGAGFVGSNAANWLSKNGYDVTAIDNCPIGTLVGLCKQGIVPHHGERRSGGHSEKPARAIHYLQQLLSRVVPKLNS